MKSPYCGAAVIALMTASPALAQIPSQEDLAELVRAQSELIRSQSAEIAELRTRLDRIEAGQAVVTAPAPVAVAAPAATTLVLAGPAAAADPAPASGVVTEWGQGLPLFRSTDGMFSFKPRGRILADVSTTTGSDFDGRNITTTGMRALRLGLEGGVGSHFFYQFESDFSENQVDVVTAFIGWRGRINPSLDYDVRAGHLFNDRSFEGSTGSDSMPFLERNVVATAIIPQRAFYGLGVMPRVFWKSGHASLTVSGDRIDGSQGVEDSRTVIARAHFNPIKTERSALHLGAWGFDEALSSTSGVLTRNTVIGGRFNGALRLSSGSIEGGTGTTGYGLELGGYRGPLWLMSEYGERHASLNAGRPDFTTEAWSLSGGWFVTGELPPYSARTGSFSQPKVLRSIFDGGRGALELTARYESLTFDGITTPAEGWAATLGANWYLNSFVRFQVNGIHWNTDNTAGAYAGEDDGQTLSGRLAVTF
ncbi:porin [Brevundimonas sp.]